FSFSGVDRCETYRELPVTATAAAAAPAMRRAGHVRAAAPAVRRAGHVRAAAPAVRRAGHVHAAAPAVRRAGHVCAAAASHHRAARGAGPTVRTRHVTRGAAVDRMAGATVEVPIVSGRDVHEACGHVARWRGDPAATIIARAEP